LKRTIAIASVAVLAAIVAAMQLRGVSEVSAPVPPMDGMSDAIGSEVMDLIHRGYVDGRSGQILLVPRPHRYLAGRWPLTTLATDEPWLNTTHPNPWNYLSSVPLILYGPGVIKEGVEFDRRVDLTAFASTYAELLGMSDFEAATEPLTEAVETSRPQQLRAIVTVVIDGGGWNVLQRHPDSHPVIDELRAGGATYTNATTGSAPSITGAIHANIGTGFYPIDHGIPGNQMQTPRGAPEEGDPTTDTWRQEADPRYLLLPTVSELWDEANGNEPTVASVSYEGWHLAMIGHGAQRDGGDRDIAVLWEAERNEWWTNEEYFELPSYVPSIDLGRLEGYESELDERDGVEDGKWFGHTLNEIQEPPIRPGTTAFVRFTGDAAMAVMRNERIGDDDTTDLFWIELKAPDFGGHLWNMLGPEQADTLKETDRQIGRLKRYLDESVGRGRYVLAVSADHGQQPLPELFGGWRINTEELERDIEERFGPIIADMNSVELFLDEAEVEDADVRLDDVVEFIGGYTIEDNIPPGMPGSDLVPEGRFGERLFAGAFTGAYLTDLSADDIEGFGGSDYPAGRLGLP
jgi:Type I phosphodiesterase / nucleotide pyrophosphatase